MKAAGYCISILSVLLLGLVAWSSASKDSLLMAALLSGMALSIIGMGLRWRSFVIEQREKRLDKY